MIFNELMAGFKDEDIELALDDPSLTQSLSISWRCPGRGGGICFRPCHDNGITFCRRAPEPLPQISEAAAPVFAFQQSAPSA